ncbi:hypothetical protein RFI_19997, partial [Reticulomyxa filosa]
MEQQQHPCTQGRWGYSDKSKSNTPGLLSVGSEHANASSNNNDSRLRVATKNQSETHKGAKTRNDNRIQKDGDDSSHTLATLANDHHRLDDEHEQNKFRIDLTLSQLDDELDDDIQNMILSSDHAEPNPSLKRKLSPPVPTDESESNVSNKYVFLFYSLFFFFFFFFPILKKKKIYYDQF